MQMIYVDYVHLNRTDRSLFRNRRGYLKM